MFDYELSDNQEQFVQDARKQGHEIDFEYSGRGMFGEKTPAVRVDNPANFNTDADIVSDQMGMGFVVYPEF